MKQTGLKVHYNAVDCFGVCLFQVYAKKGGIRSNWISTGAAAEL